MRRTRLVLFDLDGVLLDSRANMERAWAAVRAECGVAASFADYFALIGRPFGDILAELGLSERVDEIEPVYRKASLATMDQTPFFDGVLPTLAALARAGLLLGIVTSKDARRTSACLGRLPVSFATVQTPRAGCRGKPAPDHLLLALVATGTDPDEAVYVGDMASDCAAAARAHVAYLHAAWGYGAVDRTACPHIEGIRELPVALGLMAAPK
jgi:phosphoglycolate phosphatase